MPLTPIACIILPEDIAQMHYWLNEASVADVPAHSAIVFALKRLLLPGVSVRLQERGDQLQAIVDGEAVPLPAELRDWWRKCREGHPGEPLSAWITLPWPKLSRQTQSALRRSARSGSSPAPAAEAA